jgi:hypothetical protein
MSSSQLSVKKNPMLIDAKNYSDIYGQTMVVLCIKYSDEC